MTIRATFSEHDTEPVRGLPSVLPSGEYVLWAGSALVALPRPARLSRQTAGDLFRCDRRRPGTLPAEFRQLDPRVFARMFRPGGDVDRVPRDHHGNRATVGKRHDVHHHHTTRGDPTRRCPLEHRQPALQSHRVGADPEPRRWFGRYHPDHRTSATRVLSLAVAARSPRSHHSSAACAALSRRSATRRRDSRSGYADHMPGTTLGEFHHGSQDATATGTALGVSA